MGLYLCPLVELLKQHLYTKVARTLRDPRIPDSLLDEAGTMATCRCSMVLPKIGWTFLQQWVSLYHMGQEVTLFVFKVSQSPAWKGFPTDCLWPTDCLQKVRYNSLAWTDSRHHSALSEPSKTPTHTHTFFYLPTTSSPTSFLIAYAKRTKDLVHIQ